MTFFALSRAGQIFCQKCVACLEIYAAGSHSETKDPAGMKRSGIGPALNCHVVCVTFTSISLERIFRMFRRKRVLAVSTERTSATGSA